MRLTHIATSFLALGLMGLAGRVTHPAPADSPVSPPPAQEAQSQKPLRVQVTLVNVFATARDKHHAIVPDLKKEDFHIFEDGQEQKVDYFAKEVNLPITLGILVDTSGSMTNILGAEQDAGSRFVHEVMRKQDEAMVISFDLDVDLLASFTEDTAILERAIRRTRINAVGSGGAIGGTGGTLPDTRPNGTHLYDAIYLASHDELAGEAGRKAIVVLTDAEDVGSKLRVQDAIEAAQRADAVIHVILLSDAPFYARWGMGYTGAGVAKKMGDETGGRVVEVRSEKDLEKAFDQISQELRQQYVLGYYPTNTKHDGTFRKIRVEVSRADVKVLARRGYYAPTK